MTETERFERPRYHRVLVAFDGSRESKFAMGHAVALAQIDRSRLTILTVVRSPSAAVATAGTSPDTLEAQIDEEADRRLRRLAASLPDDVSVRTLVRHGAAAPEIVRVLQDEPFDLVMLGARGRGRIGSALLGSVSQQVMRSSPVPVAVIHPPREHS